MIHTESPTRPLSPHEAIARSYRFMLDRGLSREHIREGFAAWWALALHPNDSTVAKNDYTVDETRVASAVIHDGMRLFRELMGVPIGDLKTPAQREAVRGAFSLHEPACPSWAKPGAYAFSYGFDRNLRIDGILPPPNAAVVLAEREEAVPMGWFVAQFQPADPAKNVEGLPCAGCGVELRHLDTVDRPESVPDRMRCPACNSAGTVTRVVTPEPYNSVVIGDIAAPVDAANSQQGRRLAIEAVLREDARQHPAFAEARRAAVLGWMEDDGEQIQPAPVHRVRDALAHLHNHEAGVAAKRSGLRHLTAAYDRARALRCPAPQPDASVLGDMADRWGLP